MDIPTIHSIQYISIADVLSAEDHERCDEYLGEVFTWGDTDLCLVSKDTVLAALREAPHDVQEAASRLREIAERVLPNTYFAL